MSSSGTTANDPTPAPTTFESEEDPTEFGAATTAARSRAAASRLPPPPLPEPASRLPPPPLPEPAVASDANSTAHDAPSVSSPTEGSLIAFGIPLEDRGAKRITIRVIILAAAACSVSIIHFVLNLLRGNYDSRPDNTGDSNSGVWSQLSALLIELSIPVSGYMGALYHNRQLTCCYCSCNLFLAIISIMSFARFQIRLLEVNGQCYLETDPSQRNLCILWQENSIDKWVFLLNILITSAMACCAFWAGNLLYHKLAQDGEFPDLSTAPVVGEVVQLSAAFTSSSFSQPSGGPNIQVRMVTFVTVESNWSRDSNSDLASPSPIGAREAEMREQASATAAIAAV